MNFWLKSSLQRPLFKRKLLKIATLMVW